VRHDAVVFGLAHRLLRYRQTPRLFDALLARVELARPFVLIKPLIAQRVQGIQSLFDTLGTIALLAIGDIVAGEQHVVENRLRLGPLLE
jgi:hypothetical protein